MILCCLDEVNDKVFQYIDWVRKKFPSNLKPAIPKKYGVAHGEVFGWNPDWGFNEENMLDEIEILCAWNDFDEDADKRLEQAGNYFDFRIQKNLPEIHKIPIICYHNNHEVGCYMHGTILPSIDIPIREVEKLGIQSGEVFVYWSDGVGEFDLDDIEITYGYNKSVLVYHDLEDAYHDYNEHYAT